MEGDRQFAKGERMEGDMGDKGEEGGLGECKKGEPPVSVIVLMVDGEGATKGARGRWTTESTW
jgi:hypothetical protein